MAKDVLITPLDGIIQFSGSDGAGTGQIKVDSDDLVISNLVGDVLLGDGASDVFIGNGSDNVDIVFEQNGEIRDDGSGKTLTIGSKTTTLILSSSSDLTLQGGGGNVGIGTSTATVPLQVEGNISASGNIITEGHITASGDISASGLRLGGGSFTLGGNTVTDAAIVLPEGQKIYTFEDNQYFRNLIHKASDVIQIGQSGTALVDEIRLLPGNAGFTTFYGNTTEVVRVDLAGNITASGNISASGTITGLSGSFRNLDVLDNDAGVNPRFRVGRNTGENIAFSVIDLDTTITADQDSDSNGNHNFILNRTFDGSGANNFKIQKAGTDQFVIGTGGDITASGNISASGRVTTLQVGRDSTDQIDFSTDNVMIFKASNANRMKLNSSALRPNSDEGIALGTTAQKWEELVVNHITASGNISSSGTLISNEINTIGHITASGNISASGTLTANGGTFTGNVSFDDKNITNVGTIDVDEIRADAATSVKIALGTGGHIFSAQAGDLYSFNPSETDANFVYFDSTETELLHMDAGLSRIGIGDVTPVSKLDINGDLNVQSHITASGNISSSGTIVANELQDTSLTENRLTLVGANGVLTDNANFTVSTTKLTALSFDSTRGAVINEDGHSSGDFRVEGDTDTHLIFADASADKLAIGTDTVGNSLLTIDGDVTTTNITASGEISASGGLSTLSVAESSLTGSIKPVHGTFNINYGTAAQFSSSLASAGNGYGEIISHMVVHAAVSAGDVCYNVSNIWRQANAGAQSTAGDVMLAVALEDGLSSGGQPVLIRGMVRLGAGHIVDTSGDNGDSLFVSTTAGHVAFGAPSGNTEIARIVGYCMDETNDIIYFNPSSTFVEVSA